MLKLTLVNGFFAAILLAFILLPITSNWLWLGLIFIWCWSEGLIAKDPSIKWWHMLTIFIVLGALELYLVTLLK